MTDRCAACDRQPAPRSLAASSFCECCYDDELTRILVSRPATGRTVGPADSAGHIALGWRLLKCISCRATWVGPRGEACSWCQRAERDQEREQHRLNVARALRPTFVAGWVWCRAHDHAWRGQPGEVCGVHGGPRACNQPGAPLPEREVQRARER